MNNEFIVFDLETTGFSPETATILEIGAWKFKDGISTGKFEELIKPEFGVPYDITKLTGITTEMVSNCREMKDVVLEFNDFVGDLPLMGYNLPFDYRFMCNACEILGIDFTLHKMRRGIDVMKLCKKYLDLEQYTLSHCIQHFGLDKMLKDSARLHRAGVDAYMTKLVYDKIIELYPNITSVNTFMLIDSKPDRKGGTYEQEGEVLSFE